MSKNLSPTFMSYSPRPKSSISQQIPSSIRCCIQGCSKIGLMRCKCDSSKAFCPSHFEQHSHKGNALGSASSSNLLIFPKISFSSNLTGRPLHDSPDSPGSKEDERPMSPARPSSTKELVSSQTERNLSVPIEEPEVTSAPVVMESHKKVKEREIEEEKNLVKEQNSELEIIASPLLNYEEAINYYYKIETPYKMNPKKQSNIFICGCKKSSKAYSEGALANVSKFVGVGKISFNEKEDFHVDLLTSVLSKLGFEGKEDLSSPIERLTLSMSLREALSQQGSLLTLFSLLYFYKHFESKLLEILGKHTDKPFLLTCLKITQSFLPLLEKQKIQVLHENLDEIMVIYSGMVVRWFYLYEEECATWNTAFLVTHKLMKKAVLNLQSILTYVN